MNINVELPRKIPVKPPEINMLTKPIAKNIAGVNRIFPRHKVVSQLNTLIADGTAINNVAIRKWIRGKDLTLLQTCDAPKPEMQE